MYLTRCFSRKSPLSSVYNPALTRRLMSSYYIAIFLLIFPCMFVWVTTRVVVRLVCACQFMYSFKRDSKNTKQLPWNLVTSQFLLYNSLRSTRSHRTSISYATECPVAPTGTGSNAECPVAPTGTGSNGPCHSRRKFMKTFRK
jgi:hypothetical protein